MYLHYGAFRLHPYASVDVCKDVSLSQQLGTLQIFVLVMRVATQLSVGRCQLFFRALLGQYLTEVTDFIHLLTKFLGGLVQSTQKSARELEVWSTEWSGARPFAVRFSDHGQRRCDIGSLTRWIYWGRKKRSRFGAKTSRHRPMQKDRSLSVPLSCCLDVHERGYKFTPYSTCIMASWSNWHMMTSLSMLSKTKYATYHYLPVPFGTFSLNPDGAGPTSSSSDTLEWRSSSGWSSSSSSTSPYSASNDCSDWYSNSSGSLLNVSFNCIEKKQKQS